MAFFPAPVSEYLFASKRRANGRERGEWLAVFLNDNLPGIVRVMQHFGKIFARLGGTDSMNGWHVFQNSNFLNFVKLSWEFSQLTHARQFGATPLKPCPAMF